MPSKLEFVTSRHDSKRLVTLVIVILVMQCDTFTNHWHAAVVTLELIPNYSCIYSCASFRSIYKEILLSRLQNFSSLNKAQSQSSFCFIS